AYSARSRYRVTFEYVLIGGVNDSKDDARRLVELLKGVRAKVNLIPFNPYEGSPFRAPLDETVAWWSEFLYTKGIQANIRKSRGREIMAACGQLAASSSAREAGTRKAGGSHPGNG
ncbi:MAG TPA: 23S rRNA (adenine(2503)-C(2))-methyltransferase RlmN, partial [bacterium]|nr:23S rRNA (adenine(2503)-C(2))-methyltransferase RlmN [bacterium]